MKKQFYLLTFVFFNLVNAKAQNKVLLDSINKQFALATNDSVKFILKNKAFRELRLNNPAQAKEAANLCLQYAINMQNPKRVAESFSNIGLAHYYLTNIDSAIYYGNIAIEKCISSGNQEYLSNTYTNLGNIESDKKNFEAAINYYEQSLIIQKQLNNDLGVGRDNNNIAGLYAANLNYAKSLEYRLIAQRYFEKVGNKENLLIVYINLQTTYRNLKYFDKAIEMGNKSVVLSEELKKKGYTIKALRGQGNLYFDLPDLEAAKIGLQPGEQKKKAFYYLNGAVKVAQSFGNKSELSSVYNDLAYAYSQENRNEEAMQYYNICLKIDTDLNDTYSICSDKTAIGELQYKLGKYTEAERLCKEALETATKENYIDYVQENNRLLNLIYEKTGELNKALTHLKTYTAIKDSILNDSTNKAITKEIVSFEFDKKAIADSSANENEKAVITTKLKTESNRKWLFAALAIVAIAVGGLVYRFYLKKKKINQQLDKQNDTLKSLNTELIESEENLLKSNDSKEQLINMMSHDLLNPITAITNYNQQVLNREANNEELLEAFKNVDAAIQPMHSLLDNMLQWTAVQKDGIAAKIKEQDINDIIKEIISIYKPQAKLKFIKIEDQLNTPFIGNTDKSILSLILRNLLNNAIKYSANETTINVLTNATEKTITIQDEGFGMTDEMIGYLNNKQIDKIDAKGSGLGLKLCYEFAAALEAKISFQRNEAKGVTALLKLD